MQIASKDHLSEKAAFVEGVVLTGGDVDDLFTVSGGPVQILFLGIEITTAVSNNASLVNWESDPTVGAANTPISAVGGAPDIALAALGDWFVIGGDSTDVALLFANGTDLPIRESYITVPVGGIDMKLTTNAPTTGIATAYVRYKPLRADSRIT